MGEGREKGRILTPEETKAYGKGYAAVRKKRKTELNFDRQAREDAAFLDKAFLAALPALIQSSPWRTGEVQHAGVDGRVLMSWKFAREALKQRRRR